MHVHVHRTLEHSNLGGIQQANGSGSTAQLAVLFRVQVHTTMRVSHAHVPYAYPELASYMYVSMLCILCIISTQLG